MLVVVAGFVMLMVSREFVIVQEISADHCRISLGFTSTY